MNRVGYQGLNDECVLEEGSNPGTPRAIRLPTVYASPQERKKRKQSAGESSSPRKSLKITIKQKQLVKEEKDDDDSEERLEPESHKENPKVIDDDDENDDNENEEVEEKKDDKMGSLEIRTEETYTIIPTPPSSPRKILSSDKRFDQELADVVLILTTTTSKSSHSKRQISSNYSHLPVDQVLKEVVLEIVENSTKDLIEYNLKPCIAATIIKDHDAFRSEVPTFVSHEFKTHAPRIIKELSKKYVQFNVIQVHPSTHTLIEPSSLADLQYHLFLKMKRNLQDQAASESKGIPDNMYDVPFHDNSRPLDVSKDQFEEFSDSKDESTSTDDDSFFIDNVEYAEASPSDSELFSSEVMEIVIPKGGGINDDILLAIKDDILHKKLLNINLLIANIEALNDNPTPSFDFMTKSSSTYFNSLLEETNTFDNSLPEFEIFCFDLEEISSGSTTTRSDISLPDYEAFYDDHVKEINSGSTTTHSDSFLYDSFIFDLSINSFPPADRSDFYEFVDELAHIISPPEYDCFFFKNEPNLGNVTMDVVEDIFPTRDQ
uniref:Reverse transcriptase domain-containing protein n=1 Tax=Tanacetum cinerariifolium TaxID=118510 RepID=A0A6L2JVI3_TANCI|nr:hypothetical protein [Tanacetum cinerariifolium]